MSSILTESEIHSSAGAAQGGTTTPTTSDYSAQIRQFCNSAYEEAKRNNEDAEEMKQMNTYLDYLSGMQWKGQVPAHRAKPVTNRMRRLFWETVGLLTDIRPIFEVHAIDKTEIYSRTQDILNRITRAWALMTNFDVKLSMVTMYAMLSTGYAKIEWDPFADSGRGDIVILPVSPLSLLQLGADNDIQEAELVIYRRVVTLEFLRRKYPLTGYAVQPDANYSKFEMNSSAPAHISPQLFMSLSPGMRRKIGQAAEQTFSVFPKAELREFWLRDSTVNKSNKPVLVGKKDTNWCYEVQPNQPLYPRGRVIVMANNVILDDQPNPYWHGRYPFAMLRLQAVPWQFHGESVIKPWMSMQDVINQIIGGVLNMVKLAVSPPLLAPKNAFSPEAWKGLDMSRPNEKAQYSANSPHRPEFRPPPNVPAYVLQLNSIVSQEMDMSSGASAVADAARKKQIPSGDSLEQLQNARNTPIRMMGRSIEGFIGDLGMLFIPCVLQFYTAERRVELLGSQGMTPADFDASPGTLVPAGMEPEAYARKFKFKIERGSLLSTQRMERVNYAMKLYMAKAMSLRELYRILDINVDVDRMIQEMLEEAKLRAVVSPTPAKGQKKAG